MKISILILFIFTTISCSLLFQEKENEYYSLPLENKSNLQQNAVLIYESSTGETDTFYCVLKIEGIYRMALGVPEGNESGVYNRITDDCILRLKKFKKIDCNYF